MNGSEMKGMIKDTLIMFAITLIAGLLLGFTYELTKEPIAKQEQEASDRACAEVFYEADANGELQKVVDLTFEEAAADEALSAKLKEDGFKGAVIDKVFTATDSNGNVYGYVIGVTSKEGYGGDISIYVGITTDRIVKGTSILSISETPGLGMRASEVLVPQFRERKAESFLVTKAGATMDNEIDAITSATITSKAYTGAVNTALHYFDLMSANASGSTNENGGEN